MERALIPRPETSTVQEMVLNAVPLKSAPPSMASSTEGIHFTLNPFSTMSDSEIIRTIEEYGVKIKAPSNSLHQMIHDIKLLEFHKLKNFIEAVMKVIQNYEIVNAKGMVTEGSLSLEGSFEVSI